MTRSEAIEWFKNSPFYDENHEPLNMAIEALQGDMYCPNCGVRLVPEDEYLEPTQTHGRLIDADALYEYITNKVGGVDCAVLLDNEIAPTVQADRPHGEWIFNPNDAIELMFTKPKCSKCGFESADGGNFCPHCGCVMDMGKEKTQCL